MKLGSEELKYPPKDTEIGTNQERRLQASVFTEKLMSFTGQFEDCKRLCQSFKTLFPGVWHLLYGQ